MKNKFIIGFITCFTLIILVGCGLTARNQGIFGKQAAATDKQADRIEKIEKAEAVNSTERLDKIGAFSYGVKYSLDKDVNQSPEVQVAKTINERVTALANKPDFNEVKEIMGVVDGLLSQLKTQQDEAKETLAKKDKQISALITEIKELDVKKDTEIAAALKMSEANALKADQYKATLSEMDSFFGFGAIWYGVKKLITRLAWTLAIVAVLFFVLRIAAASNPIAGAVFGIFEQFVSWFINGLKFLAPKAHSMSGFIETKVFDGYKQTLTHIIDNIQLLKAKDEGEADKYTLDDLMDELAKSMDTADKERIEGIKKELRWK